MMEKRLSVQSRLLLRTHAWRYADSNTGENLSNAAVTKHSHSPTRVSYARLVNTI